ncbi:hypothetical protein PGT21_015014 [Puccinia graminis f. sp. tritici]|uniref:Pyroglutamyl-peptidase I n=1 Tax=Puccinia graminis f. sp. tritici TaxID=56615 RepID=A0A5B0LTK6_PUCGR|nr:hypothetical protein PGT21_015014 [Puccinia graminis f. sp. tritici]KAA1093552.1 hypothetical protein PGTUg99_026938 [Puccinia graminis f. sp. tritici]
MPSIPTRRPIKILLTGFGPFRNHEKNASFEIVKRASESGGFDSEDGNSAVELVVHPKPVRVSYRTVDELLSRLYHTHPDLDLVIHTGIAQLPRAEFLLEKIAHREHYKSPDVDGLLPDPSLSDSETRPASLSSSVMLDQLVERVQDQISQPINLKVSENAGRFLCEYIYYSSLLRFENLTNSNPEPPSTSVFKKEEADRARPRPVLFLHVPPFLDQADITLGSHVLLDIIHQVQALHFSSSSDNLYKKFLGSSYD